MWSYFVDYILDFSVLPHQLTKLVTYSYICTFLQDIAIGVPPLPAIKIAKYYLWRLGRGALILQKNDGAPSLCL